MRCRTPSVAIVLGAGALLVAVLRLIRTRVLLVRVHGDSMMPSLRDGSRVLVLRRSARRVRNGAIVVGRYPSTIRVGEPAADDWLYVKRLVARGPGDTSVPTAEIRTVAAAEAAGGRRVGDDVVWTLDSPDLFVRGDHPSSADSVSWGPVPASDLVGVVVARLPGST